MALSQEDKDQLSAVFGQMGVKPKMDSTADFEAWMQDYLAAKGKVDPVVKIIPQPPQIVKFSGDTKDGQASFDLWQYEVRSLMKGNIHSPEVIHQAVRRSLKGEASRVAMRLGADATLESLLAKLESVYGSVESGEDVLAQFYSALQKEDEDVVSWGFRLENILDKAIEQKQLTKTNAMEMLRSKFWTGLRQDLKDATRHSYETVTDFDRLRVQVCRVELEHGHHHETKAGKDKKVAQAKMVHATESKSQRAEPKFKEPASSTEAMNKQIEELKQLVLGLTTRVDALQTEVSNVRHQSQNVGPSHQSTHPFRQPQHPPRSTGDSDEPMCYRCGQIGHLSFGCRAKKGLNS